MHYLPPELEGNYCHIAPEWERETGQKLWFVSAPYGGTILRFKGEPTSLLYAIAPLVHEIKAGQFGSLNLSGVALLNPTVGSDELYLEIEQRLKKQELRAICIGALTASSPEARRIAELAKKISPDTITIFGGPHEDDIGLKTAVDPDYDSIVDFSVAGDGEYALLQLARIVFEHPEATATEIKSLVLEHESAFRWCDGRGGIYFRHRGQPQQIPLNGKSLDLDKLPMMPRELLHESDTHTFSVFKQGGWNVKTAQIMTHRGCAWRCSFCSESAALNLRSVESVISEIEEIKHFGERHPELVRENYKAIFFDDSTFTTSSRSRKEYLRKLYEHLKHCGLEWGCQTRLDQINEETLLAMKDAGCTYLYTGLESASDEMLRAMVKDQGRKHIDKAFEAINRVGLRVGVSLIFGVAEPDSNKTAETEETIIETLDFVERQTRQGNVVVVSPNIATYYPDTRMTAASRADIDFRNPVINRGYPWNRFEEGESYHPKGVTEKMAEFIIRESVKRFGEYLVDQDIYALEGYQEAYRKNELDRPGCAYSDLNHSSITRPLLEARIAAETIAPLEIAAQDRNSILQEARYAAATLMGLPEERSENIVLARNTTEAASLAFWLASLHRLPGNAKVLTTNAENLSVPRAFRFYMDHGNPAGRDFWSSFQDFGARRLSGYTLPKCPTGVLVEEIDVLSNTTTFEEVILRRVTPDTSMVIFSHVTRHDGRICDVEGLCNEIRQINPNAYILVDGAQALGALPKVDVAEYGCDFYVAAPHKTLGSFPVGLLYISDRVKVNINRWSSLSLAGPPRYVIIEGMFSPSLEISPTVLTQFSLPEVKGFTTAIRTLVNKDFIRGNNCWRLDQHRRSLKEAFVRGLSQNPSLQIISPLDNEHSNFILAFRFAEGDNRMVVESLWRKRLVFVSYLARKDVIRASFSPSNTMKDIERALAAIHEAQGTFVKKIGTAL